MPDSAQRRLPSRSVEATPEIVSMALERKVKRSSSSCSQYQSDDISVNVRKRSSLSRMARCARVLAVTSSAIAMYPLTSPAAFDKTVLSQLQMIVSPLLVMFSLKPSEDDSPFCR